MKNKKTPKKYFEAQGCKARGKLNTSARKGKIK